MGNKSKKSSTSTHKSTDTSSNSESFRSEEKSRIHSPKSSCVQSEKSPSGAKKKARSLKDLLKAMEPSAQELEYRKMKSGAYSAKHDYSKSFRCTKCNKNFNVNSEKCNEVQTHPCLGVLMCKECCDYYGDGEFSLDTDSEDKYCRWCGEGGTLFGCSECICGFCMTCIKKHFGLKYLRKVKKDNNWLCFFCNSKPLWNKRYICSLAVQMSQSNISTPSSVAENGKEGLENHKSPKTKTTNSKKKKYSKITQQQELSDSSSSSTELEKQTCKSLPRSGRNCSRKRIYSTSSNDSEIELPNNSPKKMKFPGQQLDGTYQKKDGFENLKQEVLEKLERIVKLSEYQMSFGVKWSSEMRKKLADAKHISTRQDLLDECQKIKWFLSALSTYLIEFCNSVDSTEKSLSKENGVKDSNNVPQPGTDPPSFATIMQFLSFITNQVNTFVKKGLSLTDVLEAEIYDDSKFIGIKKTSKPNGISSESSSSVLPQETTKANLDKNNKTGHLNTDTEDSKDEDGRDESPDEDSSKLVVDQGSEFQDGDSESTDANSSGAAVRDTGKEILQILQILEHA